MTSDSSFLRSAVPVLASLNIPTTLDFYIQTLGFERIHEELEYGIVKRDGVEIHFWKCDDRTIPESTSCRVAVSNIELLYSEYNARSVVHPNGGLELKPWGATEFAIIDEDGNLITFFEWKSNG